MENTKTRRAPSAFTLSLVGRAIKAIEREPMSAQVLANHLGISHGQLGSRLVPAIRRTIAFPSVQTLTGHPGRLCTYQLSDEDRVALETARLLTVQQIESRLGAEVLRLALEAVAMAELFPMLAQEADDGTSHGRGERFRNWVDPAIHNDLKEHCRDLEAQVEKLRGELEEAHRGR